MTDPANDLMSALYEMISDPMIRGYTFTPNGIESIDKMMRCVRTINIGLREYQDCIRDQEERIQELLQQNIDLKYEVVRLTSVSSGEDTRHTPIK